jgi:hypothetical protein
MHNECPVVWKGVVCFIGMLGEREMGRVVHSSSFHVAKIKSSVTVTVNRQCKKPQLCLPAATVRDRQERLHDSNILILGSRPSEKIASETQFICCCVRENVHCAQGQLAVNKILLKLIFD